MQTYNPTYNSKGRFNSILSLAKSLELSEEELINLSKTVENHYSQGTIPKKSGGYRNISIPSKKIKHVLKRLNSVLFSQVEFPNYLFGSIKDENNPRDYIKSAHIHCQAKILIKLDIEDFYPSITIGHVTEIYSNFFKFNNEISEILTKITTLNGSLPQGAPTSTYIANLCFFKFEPPLVSFFQQSGFEYTRLIDDITISNKNKNVGYKHIKKRLIRALETHGFNINSKKTFEQAAFNGQNYNVHGLKIDRESPRFPKKECEKIHAEVRDIIRVANSSDNNRKERGYHSRFYTVQGRTTKLKRVEYKKYPSLKKALQRYALPLPDEKECNRLNNVITNLERDYILHGHKPTYKKRFFQVKFRLIILKRLYPEETIKFKIRLEEICPIQKQRK